MNEKIPGLLGLMRRASAISLGEDNSLETIRDGKGKILILAHDVSDNARRRAENASSGRNVETVELPFSREDFGAALGMSACSMAVVTDLGFADALARLLAAENPGQYGELAERVLSRREKAERRKAQKGKKRVGTRRTNV